MLIKNTLLFLAFTLHLFSSNSSLHANTPITEAAENRRQELFRQTAENLGVSPVEALPNVWGAAMETTHPQTVITLFASRGPNANVYFGNGTEILGPAHPENVQVAIGHLLGNAERLRAKFKPAENFPVPAAGQVKFYIFTYSGILTAEVEEQKLKQGRHYLSPMYTAAHEVIGALRINATNKKQAAGGEKK